MALQFNIPSLNPPAQLPNAMSRLKDMLAAQTSQADLTNAGLSNTKLAQDTSIQAQNARNAQQDRLDEQDYQTQIAATFAKHGHNDMSGAIDDILQLPATLKSQVHTDEWLKVKEGLQKSASDAAAAQLAQQQTQQQMAAAAAQKAAEARDYPGWLQQNNLTDNVFSQAKYQQALNAARAAGKYSALGANGAINENTGEVIAPPPDRKPLVVNGNLMTPEGGLLASPPTPAPAPAPYNLPAGTQRRSADNALVATAPPNPTGAGVQLIQTTDANGNPIQQFVPKVAGAPIAAAPTAQEKNRVYQASLVSQYADRILAMIDRNPQAVGPIAGRIARGETVLGIVSPEAKDLGTALGSFTALQPILHGFRGGGQTVDHFQSVIGDQRLNAEALKASIREIKALAEGIRTGKIAVDDTGTPAGSPAPFQTSTAKAAPQGVDPAVWNVMTPQEKALWPK